MFVHRRQYAAFSLLEMLIVLTIVSTVVALTIPYMSASREEQLRSAARAIAADLDYARNLAVNYNSQYLVTVDAANRQLVIEHSGTDTSLDTIPSTPFRSADDPADQHLVRLDGMAGIDEPIAISSSYADSDPIVAVTDVEFGPLGETSRAETTVIWLTAGSGSHARYIAISINPVTGIATLGELQSTPPQGAGAGGTGGAI